MNDSAQALIDALDQLKPKDLLSMSEDQKKTLLNTTSLLFAYLMMDLGGRLIQPTDGQAH